MTMGLDMYLYAKRSFEPESEQATAVLDAAGVTLAELQAIAANDPAEAERSIYLPRWHFYDADKRERSEAVEAAAGLLDFAIEDTCGGDLRWEDDKVVVTIGAGYWRKANAIHAWFVDTCQDGVDECQPATVHPEQLALLRSLCVDAAAAYLDGDKTKAEEILSPRGGFFFGSTDVDEWWLEDVKSTIAQIERVISLAAALPGSVEFVYQSSW
jgi:hypothetical protein